MKHLISVENLTKTKIREIFKLTDKIKKNPSFYSQTLLGKIIASIFYEPSTRTRLSFESAALRLGGQIITVENGLLNSSDKKGESLEDSIKIVGLYSDLILLRHPAKNSAKIASSVSSVPLINAGSGDGEHPTQALLDCYTIFNNLGRLNNLRILILGDLKYGRAVHSLLLLLDLFENQTVYCLSDEQLELEDGFTKPLKNINFIKTQSLSEISHDINAIYQTRIQSERITKNQKFKIFELNSQNMKQFSDSTIILHPLPRNSEIARDLDSDHRACYFKQAQNGLYVRMAILLALTDNCFFCES